MDGEAAHQETPEPTETTDQTDTNNNNQADEAQLQRSKDTQIEQSHQETEGSQRAAEDAAQPQTAEDASAVDMDRPQTESTPAEGDAEEGGPDKDKVPADSKDPDVIKEEETKQKDMIEDQKGIGGEEEVKSGGDEEEEVKDRSKDKNITEKESKEKEKCVGEETTKEPEKKTPEGEVETKEKGKTNGQEKPKRKSGPPPSSLSRPRPSARSVRASTKNSIIAKFEQGAPEKPMPRNFRIQKSSSAAATGASIKQKILQWCRSKTRNYEGVNIENFSSSWSDGLAFCALIHRYFPKEFDFSSLRPKEREKNFTLAFQTAESLADCCPLLEVSDMIMMGKNPDPMCVFTYVQSLCHSLSKIEKERREKEEKEKADKEAEDKGEDAAGEALAEAVEGEPAEGEMEEGRNENEGDTAAMEETAEKEQEEADAEKSCLMDEGGREDVTA